MPIPLAYILLLLGGVLLPIERAYAYLDAGTGTSTIQFAIAVFVAAAYFAGRRFLNRKSDRSGRDQQAPERSASVEEDDGASGSPRG